jgi:outer membrane protein, adhesin transport system
MRNLQMQFAKSAYINFHKKVPVFLMICALGTAHAQMRLDQILVAAIEHHPEVRAKRNELRSAEERFNNANWQRFPSFSVQSSSIPSGTGSNTVNTVRIDQPLWTGGRISGGIDASEYRRQVSSATLAETEQQILLRAGAAFTELVRMNLRIEAADQNIQEHQRLLELIQRRATNQINPESDVVLARARLQQSKSEIIQFRNMANNARADLEQIMGRKLEPITVPAYTSLMLTDLENSLQELLQNSPTFKRLEAEIKAADADIVTRKSVYWPTISARVERFYGGVGRDGTSYLALNFQPGAGLSAQSAIQEAIARKDAAENTLQSSRKDLSDKVRADWNQRQTTMADALVIDELVAATESIYESFLRQFPVGRKSWMELLNARKEATQAKYALADARWTGFLAAFRVAVATGDVSAQKPLNLNNTSSK